MGTCCDVPTLSGPGTRLDEGGLLAEGAELVVEHRLADDVQRHGVELVLDVHGDVVGGGGGELIREVRCGGAEERGHVLEPRAVKSGANRGSALGPDLLGGGDESVAHDGLHDIGEDALAEGVGVVLEHVAHGDGVGDDDEPLGTGAEVVHASVLAVVIVERDEEGRGADLLLEEVAEDALGDRGAVAPGKDAGDGAPHVSASLGNLEAGGERAAVRGRFLPAGLDPGLLHSRARDDARRAPGHAAPLAAPGHAGVHRAPTARLVIEDDHIIVRTNARVVVPLRLRCTPHPRSGDTIRPAGRDLRFGMIAPRHADRRFMGQDVGAASEVDRGVPMNVHPGKKLCSSDSQRFHLV